MWPLVSHRETWGQFEVEALVLSAGPGSTGPADFEGQFHTGWGPPVISWFINPMNTIVVSIMHYGYVVICTNLANELGPHPILMT